VIDRTHRRRTALAGAAGAGIIAVVIALPLNGQAAASSVKCPQRIVSISPTATEDLFAIGAGPRVVAVDSDSNYPAAAQRVRKPGLVAYTPSAEAILGTYRPNLVIVSYDANHVVEGLRKGGVRVLFENTAANLSGAYNQIEAIGAATCRLGAARAEVGSIKRQIASVARAARPLAAGLTYYDEISAPAQSQNPYAASSRSFIGQLFGLLGMRNITNDPSGYPALSQEAIIASNPQLMFLSDNQPLDGGVTPKSVRSRTGWSSISAVAHNAIYGLNDDAASRWGPRVTVLIRQIASSVRTYRRQH